jgi:ribonuclease VapC
MIVDTSAIISLLKEEPDSAPLSDVMLDHQPHLRISAANYLEAAIVIDANGDAPLSARLDEVMAFFGIEIEPVTGEHARIARAAYRLYGKGNHPARLNFGDCFAYALAKSTGEALLFKGGDFAQTDVARAFPA